jgi:uncharacterized membrane protein
MAQRTGIGNRIAPPHFIAFVFGMVIAVSAASQMIKLALAMMAGFDVAAVLFLAWASRLLRTREGMTIRGHARENDANRGILLATTFVVVIVLLIAMGAEAVGRSPQPLTKILIILTLVIAWLFTNSIYALHYAHLAYGDDDAGCKGLNFPGTSEPLYWDFLYFAFTLGMTFQTSDVEISDQRIRKVVTLHSLAAFVFNIGVLAFTINVLGSA